MRTEWDNENDEVAKASTLDRFLLNSITETASLKFEAVPCLCLRMACFSTLAMQPVSSVSSASFESIGKEQSFQVTKS